MKLLVCDHTESVRRRIYVSLSRKGVDVITAENGSEALALLSRETVDVVLLDQRLPGLSGPEVLKRIKENPATTKIPVLMLTLVEDTQLATSCLQSGAAGFVLKPIVTRRLLAVLEQVSKSEAPEPQVQEAAKVAEPPVPVLSAHNESPEEHEVLAIRKHVFAIVRLLGPLLLSTRSRLALALRQHPSSRALQSLSIRMTDLELALTGLIVESGALAEPPAPRTES